MGRGRSIELSLFNYDTGLIGYKKNRTSTESSNTAMTQEDRPTENASSKRPPSWNKVVSRLHPIVKVFALIEYPAGWWVWLWRQSAGVRTLVEFTGAVIVILGVAGFYIEFQNRQEDRATRNAQLIAQISSLAAINNPTNADVGILTVMEFLAKEKVFMTGLSVSGTNLQYFKEQSTPEHKISTSTVRAFGAKLSGAYLSYANLSKTRLRGADLSNAYLLFANLSSADLYAANFSDAELINANLSKSVLIKANLFNAKLFGVNLSGANLTDSNLSDALLVGANLSDANLTNANISKVDMEFVKNLTQNQLDKACANPKTPPIKLPGDLEWHDNECPIEKDWM